LYCHILHFAILQHDFAALIDRKPRGKFIPILRNQDFQAGFPKLLFIRGGQENHVAVQMNVSAFQRDERSQVRHQHALVVDRSSAIEIPIFDHAAERVDRPLALVHSHDIHVRHQQQRLRRVRHGAASQPSNQRAAPRRYDLVVAADVFVYLFDLDPVARAVADVLSPGGLFAFTVETHDGDGVELGEKLRYRHGAAHVRTAVSSAPLQLLERAPVATRIESGGTVPGLLAVAMRDHNGGLP
jgi:SAM-dependent methyltransferase